MSRPRADSVDQHFKKGYLRIKQKGTIKTKFPLLVVFCSVFSSFLVISFDWMTDSA